MFSEDVTRHKDLRMETSTKEDIFLGKHGKAVSNRKMKVKKESPKSQTEFEGLKKFMAIQAY